MFFFPFRWWILCRKEKVSLVYNLTLLCSSSTERVARHVYVLGRRPKVDWGMTSPPLCCDFFFFVACVYTLLLKMEVDLAL